MSDTNHRVAMFRQTENATFKNVTFTNVKITSNGNNSGHAVLVGYHNSGSLTFENVHINSGTISGYRWMGALAGEIAANSSGNRLTMTNCSNGATITGRNQAVGGLAGYSKPAVYATNCTNNGNVSSQSTDVGGIVGWIEDDPSTFKDCTNNGNISSTADTVGGIVGYFGSRSQDQKLTLTNNTNTGTITSTGGRAGGIAAYIDTDNNAHSISGNKNSGTIHGKSDAGGIVASNMGFGAWNDNINYGNVTADDDNAGGILGEVQDDYQEFSNCYNTGNVQGKNSVGGIIGYGQDGEHSFYRCANSGSITSTNDCAAGIYGYGNESQPTFSECWNIGNIYANHDGGGMMGKSSHHTTFHRCWNAGTIDTYNNQGGSYHGGIVGYTGNLERSTNASNAIMTDCFNWGTVKGGSLNAGLVAYVQKGNTGWFGTGGNRNYYIINSYSTGNISGGTAKAITADGGSGAENCYKTIDPGNGWGTLKTDQEMRDYSNFTLSDNFCKNTWGVTIRGTTYYYPIHTWYRNLFVFESRFYDTNTSTDTTVKKQYNEYFTTPNPARHGYDLQYWYVSTDSSKRLSPNVTVRAGSTDPMHTFTVTQDTAELTHIYNQTTFYAQWERHREKLDMNFYVNESYGFDSNVYFTADVYVNGVLRADDVTDFYDDLYYEDTYEIKDIKPASGYICVGAFLGVHDGRRQSGLTGQMDVSLIEVAPDIRSLQNVTFNGNGADSGSMDPQAFAYHIAQDLNANGYAYTNHIFNGWNTEANGTGTPYSDGASYTNPSTTPNAGLTLYAQWFRPTTDDVFVLDFGLTAKLDVLANDLTGVTLVSVAPGAGYTASVKDGKIEFTPAAAMMDVITLTYTATYQNKDYTATATVIPANNVYYEDDFFDFFDTSGTAWSSAGTLKSGAVQQAVEAAKEDSADLYGADAAYDTSDTYSLGRARCVTVTKDAKKAALASFTFTGTGFDLYALTDSTTGFAMVDIYKVENGAETKVEGLMVNTYYGYEYGQLYLNDDTVTLDNSYPPIYYAPEGETGSGTFFINGTRRGWLTPTYYSGADNTVAVGESANHPAYAYGWVAKSVSEGDGVYQAPVISKMGLDYGTYRVTVQPRYSAVQDTAHKGSYTFYIDSVRVYNPLNPEALPPEAQPVYNADNENSAQFIDLRDQLLKKETAVAVAEGGDPDAWIDGIVFLENKGVRRTTIENYTDIGPKNEIYLARNQSIAFNLNTTAKAEPAKLALGMKLVKGAAGSVQVSSASTVTFNLTGKTDQFRDITGAVQWANATGGYHTTAPIVITNTSSDGVIISLTKLKWSFNQFVPKAQRAMSFRFAARNLAFVGSVMDEINDEQTTASSEGVTVTWDNAEVEIGGTATLTITAPATFEKAFRDGNEIAGYTELPDGSRQWTVTVTVEEAGEYACDIMLEDENGYRTKAISAGSFTVVPPAEPDPVDNGSGTGDQTGSGTDSGTDNTPGRRSFNDLLQAIISFFRKIVAFFRGLIR